MAAPGRLRSHWGETPLTSRLVILILVIIATALTILGTVMIGILHRHLIRQVDDQLASTAGQLATKVASDSITDAATAIPTNYYIRSDIVGHEPIQLMTAGTEEQAGVPLVDSVLRDQKLAPLSGISRPVTVKSTLPDATWRIVFVPVVLSTTGQPAGIVTVGLPLVDVVETVSNTAVSYFWASFSLLALGGVLSYFLVRQSLRPLREIEITAGKIAGGDLSQRIQPDFPTTEVGSLSLSLNAMLSQIEASFKARDESERKVRRFISDASHELRTPLAAIRGYGELYRLGGVPPERVGDVMGRIESESRRMGTLVEDLLVLARVDERRPLALTEVDLVRLARDGQSDLEALDPTRPVKIQGLSSRKPPSAVLVRGDLDQLTQVVVNVVGNIDRYTPKSTPVEIRVGAEDEWGVLEFRDHGPGIDSDEQDQVFERFYRTDRSRSRDLGGSGLGLSIVGGIIDAHQGTVKLSETPQGGLTVTVKIPLC